MSVLGTAKNILVFSRDYAAENRRINTANLALMGIWCLLAYFLFWGCVHHLFLDGRVTSCLGENDLERVGDLATGLLFIWMDMGERATGKSITVVPIHMAYSSLKEKSLQYFIVSSWTWANNLQKIAEGRVKKWINSSSVLHPPSFERG